MTTYAATPEHIADFLELLRALEKDITLDIPGIASKLDGLTVESGHSAYFSACPEGAAAPYAPFVPVACLIGGPQAYFGEEPALALLLIEDGDLIYGNFLFADKRRILALPGEAVLDDTNEMSGIDPDGTVVFDGTPAAVHILLHRMVQTFPPLDERGEAIRRQIIAKIQT